MSATPIYPPGAEISKELTDFATAYTNSQFIANEVSPPILVNLRSDEFPKRVRSDSARRPDDLVGYRGKIQEISYSTEPGTYLLKNRGLASVVDESLRSASLGQALDPEQEAVYHTMNAIMLNREHRVAALTMAQGSWATANTFAAVNPWTSHNDGNPVADIKAALQTIPFNGEDVEVIGVCSDVVFDTLQQHPRVVDLKAGGSVVDGMLTADAIAKALGLNKIVTSKVQSLSSVAGVTPTYARIWGGTTFALVVRQRTIPNPRATLFSCSFMHDLDARWTQPDGTMVPQPGVRVRTWRDPGAGFGGSTWIAVEMAIDDEQVIQNDAGCLIRSVI